MSLTAWRCLVHCGGRCLRAHYGMPVAGIACLCSSHLGLKVAMLSAQGQVKPPRLVLVWLTSWISLQSRTFCKIKAACLWSCGLQKRSVVFVWHCVCVPFNNHVCYLFWRWYWVLRQITTLLKLFSSPSSLHKEGHVPLRVNTYFLEDFFLLVVIGVAFTVSKSNLLNSTSICAKHLQMVQKCSGTLSSPFPHGVYKVLPWSTLARGETENFPACHGFLFTATSWLWHTFNLMKTQQAVPEGCFSF